MTVSYGKGDKGKATRLVSEIVRSRGACQRCGESNYSKLVAAHIIRRTPAATRTREENHWCLCASCHWWVDNYAHLFMELVDSTIGRDEYDRLFALANHGTTKVDWTAELERLKAVWSEITDEIESEIA